MKEIANTVMIEDAIQSKINYLTYHKIDEITNESHKRSLQTSL